MKQTREVVIGEKFGKLTVVGKSTVRTNGYIHSELNCVCGEKVVRKNAELLSRSGNKTSCGNCKTNKGESNPNWRHGQKNTRLYKIWRGMLERCYNKNCSSYHLYGGSGVQVEEHWIVDFMNFYNDVISDYKDNLSIDRIDGTGNYENGNVRWVNKNLQGYNQKKRVDNSSGVTGVSFDRSKSKWVSYINVEGKRIYLGSFDKKEDAIAQRLAAEQSMMPEMKPEHRYSTEG